MLARVVQSSALPFDVFVAHTDKYKKNNKVYQTMSMSIIDDKIKVILNNYFQEELSQDFLEQFTTVTLSGGHWLFRQGDDADALYFLIRGRVEAWIETGDPEQPSYMMGEMLPGESIGDIGLITGEKRSASIKAVRDSQLLKISKEVFESLTKSHPTLVLKLASNIAKLLLKNNPNKRTQSEEMKTIGLFPLSEDPNIDHFFDIFEQQFTEQSTIIWIEPNRFKALGAPATELKADEDIDGDLKNWLFDLEDKYDFVIFKCSVANDGWARFVERQSDTMLMIGNANQASSSVQWNSLPDSCNSCDARHRALILLRSSKIEIEDTMSWLADRQFEYHLHLRCGNLRDVRRAIRMVSGKSIGLVIGSGAARGFAGIGVYKALVEADIQIDWVGGTSVGAIIAAVIANDFSPSEAISIFQKSFRSTNPFGDLTIPVLALLRGSRLKKLLEKHLDIQVENLPKPYFCVSANLGRGKTNIHESGSLVRSMRASAALPGVFPPVVVNRELAIDGAILNNLPVDIMRQKPVSKIIAIDFCTTTSLKVDYEETPSPWAILRGRWLPFFKRYRTPSFTSLILKSTETATLEQVRKHGAMADLLIDPDIRNFGMTDVKSFNEIVEVGYTRTKELLTPTEIEKLNY